MKYWLAILQKSEIFCGLEGQGSQWAVTMNWEDLKFSVWSWTRPLASLMFGTLCAWKIHLQDWRLTPPPRYGQHCRLNICSYIRWIDKYCICQYNQYNYKYWDASAVHPDNGGFRQTKEQIHVKILKARLFLWKWTCESGWVNSSEFLFLTHFLLFFERLKVNSTTQIMEDFDK